MNSAYNQLKKELSILYPDVTDIELNEMTNNLIDFFIRSGSFTKGRFDE